MAWRLGAIAIVVAALLAPGALAGEWTQQGASGSKSYSTRDPIPFAEEVAFTVELPVRMVPPSNLAMREPLVVGDAIYVHTVEGILTVSLADGAIDELVQLEGIARIATDGERLVAITDDGVSAFTLAGAPLWEYSFPIVINSPPATHGCPAPSIGQGLLFLHCRQQTEKVPDDGNGVLANWGDVDSSMFLVVLDLASGATAWTHQFEPSREGLAGDYPVGSSFGSFPIGTATEGGIVVAGSVYDLSTSGGLAQRRIDAFDAASGSHRWGRTLMDRAPTGAPTVRTDPPAVDYVDSLVTSGKPQGPLMSGGSVVMLLEDLLELRADTGEIKRQVAFDEGTHNARWALQDGVLYSAWFTSLRSLGESDEFVLIHELDQGKMWNWLARTEGWTIGLAHDMSTEGRTDGDERLQWLQAFSDDGSRTWTHQFYAGPDADVALANGLVVIADYPQNITVLGRTAASVVPTFVVSSFYPAPDETMTVDLTGTRAGMMAPDLEHQVDWGDGIVSQWQASPILEHTYAANGDYVATIAVRNSAGQRSVETATIHVGGTAPIEPGFLLEQFSADNQERTFFILGLLVTALVALLGFLRVRRKRGILARELAAVDQLYAMTRAKPTECDAALAERKTRARALLVDGAIDEGQFGVLEKRIDELHRQARFDTIEDQMGFLPVSLARQLKSLLADGRIERWERSHFAGIVDADPHLTLEQKARVMTLVDAWLSADNAGAPDPHDARSVVRP